MMADENLSLSCLTTFDFSPEKVDAHLAKMEVVRQSYRDLYGEKWREIYYADREREQDLINRKYINGKIYSTGLVSCCPGDRISDRERDEFDARLRAVYGDQYDEIKANRVDFDPRVAELLIQEALRTGEWEVLPDELQSLYHERKDLA